MGWEDIFFRVVCMCMRENVCTHVCVYVCACVGCWVGMGLWWEDIFFWVVCVCGVREHYIFQCCFTHFTLGNIIDTNTNISTLKEKKSIHLR